MTPTQLPLIRPTDRIYVAGHRGMAGSAIVRRLRRGGYGSSGGGELLTADRAELNLLDSSAVEQWFEAHRPDVVVVAAAKVGGIYANATYPADFLLENLKISTHIIEVAWRSGVRRLLFLGSSCLYPKLAEQPIREEALLSGSLEPTNECYAIAKVAGIKLCESLRRQYGFDAFSLMPTNLYGPGDNYHPANSHVMAALIRRFHTAKEAKAPFVSCWGSGLPRREFLHVDDLADAVVFCLKFWQPDLVNGISNSVLNHLNVGSGVDLSIRELADLVAKIVDFRGEICWDDSKPDGTPRKLLDVSRLNALGWAASIPLEEGIRTTYKKDCCFSDVSTKRFYISAT